MSERKISLDFEDAQRIFDLAVEADLACSGYMDSDEVASMRRLAVAIGVDPAVCTGEEFVTQYPHPFKADLDQYRQRITMNAEERKSYGLLSEVVRRRSETDDEVIARLGGDPTDGVCMAGRWKGRCGKPVDDPIHQTAIEAAEMGAPAA